MKSMLPSPREAGHRSRGNFHHPESTTSLAFFRYERYNTRVMAGETKNFWEDRDLSELTREQWEQLCDGCGRCCLVKLEDADTGQLDYTSVACRLLNVETCRCRHYDERWELADDCVILTPDTIAELDWLPSTCAYRRLAQGMPLPAWHPLITGTTESVHAAGISVKNRVISEEYVADDDFENFITPTLR